MTYAGSDHDYWLDQGDESEQVEDEAVLDLDHDLEPIAAIPTVDQWEEKEEAHETLIENILAGDGL